jgi:hypothetical protein
MGGDAVVFSATEILRSGFRAYHPLRVVRQIANAVLISLSGECAKLYSPIGGDRSHRSG